MRWKPLTLIPCSELIQSWWVLVGFGCGINTRGVDETEKVLSAVLAGLDCHTPTLLQLWWHLWLSLSPSALAVVPAQPLAVCPAQSRERVHPSLTPASHTALTSAASSNSRLWTGLPHAPFCAPLQGTLMRAGREAAGEQLEVLKFGPLQLNLPNLISLCQSTQLTHPGTGVEPEHHQIAAFNTMHQPGWDRLKKNTSYNRHSWVLQ